MLIHVVALILVLRNFNELEIYEKPSYRIDYCLWSMLTLHSS